MNLYIIQNEEGWYRAARGRTDKLQNAKKFNARNHAQSSLTQSLNPKIWKVKILHLELTGITE